MVESLRELNNLCQKPDYKTKGNWYVRTILRDASLPVTWLLLHTRVTANQVTLVSLAVSFAGMVFLAIPGTGAFLTGAVLLQFWYYLDHVDGQIARYRKTACLTGRFLDFMTHHIVHTALFFAMGFYVFAISQNVFFVIWGFIASLAISVLNLVHDVKYKTFFERLESVRTAQSVILKPKAEESQPETLRKKATQDDAGAGNVPKRIFSFLHKFCEIHVMMNILSLAALSQLFVKGFDLRIMLFLIYGVLALILAITKLIHIIKTLAIDEEYKKYVS